MEASDRLHQALAARAHAKLFEDGYGWIGSADTEAARLDARASERELELALRALSEAWYLEDKHHGSYVVMPRYALLYETEIERSEFWRRNKLRRKMLAALIQADEAGYLGFDFNAGEDGWTEHSQGELVAAGRTLEALGLAAVISETSGYIGLKLTSDGIRASTDPRELARTLPLSAADDDEAGALVVADAIRPLIFDCEQLMRERKWTEALNELKAGDTAFSDERWKDAVGEYYRAIESGLKYRLDEAGIAHGETAALRKLAALAVEHDLFPVNYQELFSFINSIRSPRAHGGGPRPTDVAIGRHEALLMANHVRALLLYLGGRAS